MIPKNLKRFCLTNESKDENQEEKNRLKVQSKKMVFELNDEDMTATIICFNHPYRDIDIPRAIKYKSQEYLITSFVPNVTIPLNSIKFAPDSELHVTPDYAFTNSQIKEISIHPGLTTISKYSFSNCPNLEVVNFQPGSQLQIIENDAFFKTPIKTFSIPSHVTQICSSVFGYCPRLQKVEVTANSELKKIEKDAFKHSSIVSISLPSSISELDDGWCKDIQNLNDITIFQCEQKNIVYFDDKFILQKSDPESDVYDILVFARRDIKTVEIPPFIKKISPYAFEYCTSIEKVEFPENSELREIGCYAFHRSSIKSISIPPHLTTIGDGCFKLCSLFKSIEFTENSELKTIGDFAFNNSNIERISIPLHLTSIGEESFSFCKKLKKVDIPENCELQTIGKKAFSNSSIEKVLTSHHLTLIQESAFCCCYKLKQLLVAPNLNHQHQKIGKELFGSFTPIKKLSIPSDVEFEEGWSCGMTKLTTIEIIESVRPDIIYYEDKYILKKSNCDSELYDVLVFARRDIESASIPSFIKVIGPFAFNGCKMLEKIEIQENSELSIIDNYAFASSSINEIKIPSTVKKIGERAFSYCYKLTRVEFENDSKLEEIGMEAFSSSSIKNILIPPSVLRIGDGSFGYCNMLKKVEIPINSNLAEIGKFCFVYSLIEQFSIPKNVVQINQSTFENCKKLKAIEFSENSICKEFDKQAFFYCPIETISIPSSVTKICEHVFSDKVRKIKINEDSKLQEIGFASFYNTLIGSLFIPPLVKTIDDNAFHNCNNLQIIEIGENSQLESFPYSKMKNVMIMAPPFFMDSIPENEKKEDSFFKKFMKH